MRIRTIKPEFWTNEALCQCSEFTRLLALALLNWSDDEGYFIANPIIIKGHLFPFYDDSTIVRRSIDDLSRIGWIEVGKDHEGRAVGRVINFEKHQRIDRPKASKIKEIYRVFDDSTTHRRRIDDASLLEQGTGNREQGTSNNNNNNSAREVETFAEAPSLDSALRFGETQMIPAAMVEKWHGNSELNQWACLANGKHWSKNLLAYWKSIPPADQRKWRDIPANGQSTNKCLAEKTSRPKPEVKFRDIEEVISEQAQPETL